jgi:hypothetical protein
MLSLIAELIPALSGGLIGLVPSVFKQFISSSRQKRDNNHEIAMLTLSYTFAQQQQQITLQERESLHQSKATIAKVSHDIALGKETGFQGFLRATVRPVCTYAIVFPLAYTMWQAVFLSRSIHELSLFIPPDLIQFTITSVITFWFSAQAMKSGK